MYNNIHMFVIIHSVLTNFRDKHTLTSGYWVLPPLDSISSGQAELQSHQS